MKAEANWMETSLNSPTRHAIQFSSKPTFLTSSTLSRPLSETEAEIYSHPLICQVMAISSRRSIRYDIHQIDPHTPLYAVPLASAECCPQQLSASTCSALVKEMRAGLAEREEMRAGSAGKANQSGETSRRSQKISVSGMVTYRFKSMKAEKSLGLGGFDYELRLRNETASVKQRQNCSSERHHRALSRSSKHRCQQLLKAEQAVSADSTLPTEAFLAKMLVMKKQETLIYGQRSRKLNYVQQYMAQEAADYELADNVVSQLDQKPSVRTPKKPAADRKSDDTQLSARRVPSQKKPALVRHFHFIE